MIDTSNNTVVETVAAGTTPFAFGDFIGAAVIPLEVIFANGFED